MLQLFSKHFQRLSLTRGGSTRHVRDMEADDDPLADTPLRRAQQRVAFARAEEQLRGRRDLRAEIQHVTIAGWIAAKMETTGDVLKNVVTDAAEEFGVSERTVWTAWKRRNVAK
jgi:hypothetical protein